MMKIILASKSPRRKELLEEMKIDFECIPSNYDEKINDKLDVYQNVMNLARGKCLDVYKDHPNDIVLGCDTIVVLDGIIYGKPKDTNDAYLMLKKLSGRTHEVISGVMIKSKNYEDNFYVSSYVTFKELSDKEIFDYINTKEPLDKAGSYGIQGLGGKLISKYEGSLNNIIGLPTEKLLIELKKHFDF